MATIVNLNERIVRALGEQLLQICSLQAENEALKAELAALTKPKEE